MMRQSSVDYGYHPNFLDERYEIFIDVVYDEVKMIINMLQLNKTQIERCKKDGKAMARNLSKMSIIVRKSSKVA